MTSGTLPPATRGLSFIPKKSCTRDATQGGFPRS